MPWAGLVLSLEIKLIDNLQFTAQQMDRVEKQRNANAYVLLSTIIYVNDEIPPSET